MIVNPARKAVLATAVLLSSVATAGPAAATADATAERLAGETRFGTAEAIAKDTFTAADTALVATGRTYADALAASALAGPSAAPILLVERDSVPAPTTSALRDLGVSKVVILGGTAAVSAAVAAELDKDHEVTRVAGTTRYGTAAEIGRAVQHTDGGIGAFDGKRAAFLASGEGFPDALAVGPIAAFGSLPVLLTRPGAIPAETDAALDELGIELVIVAGGTAAVSSQVEEAVAAKGIETMRLGGETRQDTARLLADFAVDRFGFSGTHVDIARGDRFPDALAGGPHAGFHESAPILLTEGETLGSAASDWISGRCATIDSLDVFGGTAAVPASAMDAAVRAARSC